MAASAVRCVCGVYCFKPLGLLSLCHAECGCNVCPAAAQGSHKHVRKSATHPVSCCCGAPRDMLTGSSFSALPAQQRHGHINLTIIQA
jgi:hypothetical protein